MDKRNALPEKTDEEIIAAYAEFLNVVKGARGTVKFGKEIIKTDDIVGDIQKQTRLREMFIELYRNGETAVREL